MSLRVIEGPQQIKLPGKVEGRLGGSQTAGTPMPQPACNPLEVSSQTLGFAGCAMGDTYWDRMPGKVEVCEALD